MLRNSVATGATASIQPVKSRQSGILLVMADAWLQRWRSRRALAQLDDRLLRDIGLSPSEAITESAMPFWKPLIWLQGK